MASQNTLVANGDITNTDTSGYQILQTTDVTLTASQFAGFSSIVSNMGGTGGFIYGATGGTYDLEGKSTEPYTMVAQSNAGTTLIGNDANGEGLTASTSGADTLQAGNGTGDRLFAGGGTDKLIAGNGGDQLYIGGGVDTVIGGSGGDTFIIGQTGTYLSVATGTTLQGGTGQDKLIVSSPIQDISGVNISGIETLQAVSVTLTASQLAGFTMVTSGGSILPLSIYASTGGTYDLRGKSTEAFALNAQSNAGSVLIGDDAVGQALRASASGNDTLQAGNGKGDLLYAGGGADRLIAGSGAGDQLYGGSGTDTFVLSNTGSATVTGGSGINIAVFAGNEASYSFSASLVSGGLKTTVTNKSTGVADTLTNVQTLQFADVSTDPLSAAGGPLSLLADPVVEAAVASQMVGDFLSYSGMLTVLQDVANQGAVTASEFSSLQTLASLLNASGGIAASSYVKDIATRLIDGDPANQYWTGGGTAVALGDLASGSSAAQLNELIGKWFLGTDLPDFTGYSAQYNTDSDPLLGSSGVAVYTDANQGKLDDCYLIASLGEVALKDPGSIETMITGNGNGTYGVRFFVNGKPEYVTVNAELPYFTNGKVWANGSTLTFANGSPIWAALVEKAFAELNAEPGVTGEKTAGNSYPDIAFGGAKPIALITGKTINSYNYASYSSEAAWQSAILPIAGSAFNAGEEVLVGTSPTQIADPSRFVVNHMFEVTGYNSSTGLFTLHNPWGSDYSGTNPAVTFTASMTDLYNNGCDIYVASGQAILPAPTPKDFNGDGTSDILFTNSSGTLADWTIANGTYSGWNGIASAAGWTVAGTGDFNGDGTSDVLFSNGSGTLVDWTLKNGTYSGWNGIGSAPGWTVAGTGDFNGDGTSDVLFQNGSGEVVDWTMKNGTFAGWNDIGNAAGWKVAGTGDFNGDGTSDILFQNGSGEVVDWMLKNGTFAGWNDVGNAAGWTVAGTGDFNGDGTRDILFQNGSGEVVDWMLKNGAFAGWNDIGNAAGWTVAGTGDYSGNGTSDILFQNGSGEVVDWMMKNGAFSGWHDIGNAAGWKAG